MNEVIETVRNLLHNQAIVGMACGVVVALLGIRTSVRLGEKLVPVREDDWWEQMVKRQQHKPPPDSWSSWD
jgi:hypothetical protein